MHELALAMDIIRTIEWHRARDSFTTVGRVFLEIGSLSCVDQHALRTSFAVARNDTVAENASLEIVINPGVARCRTCDDVFTITEFGVPCPCGSFRLSVESGRTMRITEMEVA